MSPAAPGPAAPARGEPRPVLRNRHFFALDLLLLPAAAIGAFILRLDLAGLEHYGAAIGLYVALSLPVKLAVFYRLGLYRRLWRYASINELLRIAAATGLSGLLVAVLLWALALPLTGVACPRSIPVIDALLTGLAAGGPRFAVRLLWRRHARPSGGARQQRVLVMGAGDAGAMIVQEMLDNPHLGLVPVGFLDDHPAKHGLRIHGVPVLGGRECIPDVAREGQVGEVIIAIPSAPGSAIRRIVALCHQADVPTRTVPGLYEILSGRVSVSQIREVEIEDLLRREPVRIDATAVEQLIQGRRVLVTGAGGSIGSELCRQLARAGPQRLVLLGHGENSIFHIYAELQAWAPCGLDAVIADTRDRGRLARLFARHQPELVFHAAAHKHVPLMEANVCEAISNNVLGTHRLLQVVGAAQVSHFVLISTDKAVNPTSIMGATKRVAELLTYQAAQRNGGCYVAVRFGNVLGSRGSVVHTFQRQIARGQAVTVTHPEMRRYFMTIPEAVQLVLQAAALGQGGEVFVLDMGEPIRIVDLATDLVRLSGLRPRVRLDDSDGSPAGDGGDGEWDVEVVFTGPRPGEKLSEELFAEGEMCGRTCHDKIFVAVDGQDPPAYVHLDEQVERLAELALAGDEARARRLLAQIVPEYRPVAAGRRERA